MVLVQSAVNRNLSLSTNAIDYAIVAAIITDAATFRAQIVALHPLYEMNPLQLNYLAGILGDGAGTDVFECLARLRIDLNNPLERDFLAEAAGGGVAPEDYIIANLGTGAWWHDTSPMFQDDAGLTPATANLDPVGRIDDLGANEHHLYQTSLAAKPRINTNALNGYRGVSFDGGDLLATLTNISISTFMIWIVYRSVNSGTIVYEHSANTNTGNGSWLLSGNTNTIRARRTAGDSMYSSTATADNTWRAARQAMNGTHASHTFALNGTIQSATGVNTGNPGAVAASAQLFMGGRSGAVVPTTGAYASFLIVSPYPDAAFITFVNNYFANRYALPLA